MRSLKLLASLLLLVAVGAVLFSAAAHGAEWRKLVDEDDEVLSFVDELMAERRIGRRSSGGFSRPSAPRPPTPPRRPTPRPAPRPAPRPPTPPRRPAPRPTPRPAPRPAPRPPTPPRRPAPRPTPRPAPRPPTPPKRPTPSPTRRPAPRPTPRPAPRPPKRPTPRPTPRPPTPPKRPRPGNAPKKTTKPPIPPKRPVPKPPKPPIPPKRPAHLVNPPKKGGVSPTVLRKAIPQLSEKKATQYTPLIEKAMKEAGITTKNQRAAFLAQLAHESGGLQWFEEFASGKAYEGRKDLGNTRPGDGVRYKGRGPIQLTGRANYAAAGKALGLPLEQNPELAAQPEIGFRVAAWYWNSRGLNKYADGTQEGFDKITKRINGGFTNKEDRDEYFRKFQQVLG